MDLKGLVVFSLSRSNEKFPRVSKCCLNLYWFRTLHEERDLEN